MRDDAGDQPVLWVPSICEAFVRFKPVRSGWHGQGVWSQFRNVLAVLADTMAHIRCMCIACCCRPAGAQWASRISRIAMLLSAQTKSPPQVSRSSARCRRCSPEGSSQKLALCVYLGWKLLILPILGHARREEGRPGCKVGGRLFAAPKAYGEELTTHD